MSAFTQAQAALESSPSAHMTVIRIADLAELLDQLAGYCPEHKFCSFCYGHHCQAHDTGGDYVQCDVGVEIHCYGCARECGPCRVAMAADVYVRPNK